ncbi:MAG TPA: peptidase M10 [Flavisolibacter sp.]
MGIVEFEGRSKSVLIQSHIITYGNAASSALTDQIRDEIETMWNEAHGRVVLDNESYLIQFQITAETKATITELEILQNVNPRNNYFRIEEFVHGSISFVDGLGCNSGYFLLENLYKGSTTAAHEYGHTLGLDHPRILDIRGQGVPGIMYPRGTLVDAQYQYDSTIPAGQKGGTMHPMYRKVKQEDIQNLRLHRLTFENRRATIGDFTNIYHWNHAESGPENFFTPPFFG